MNKPSVEKDTRGRTIVKWLLIVLMVFVLGQLAAAFPKWTGQGGDGGGDSDRVKVGTSVVEHQ